MVRSFQARARPPEAAASTALMMGSYPVQGGADIAQIAFDDSSRRADGWWYEKGLAAIAYPECNSRTALRNASMKASCSGCKVGRP